MQVEAFSHEAYPFRPLAAGPLGLVSLLNVVLLLLFFFLLGSSFVLQPGIMVTRLPYSPFNLPPQVNARLVTLQPGPPLRIFYQDQRVTLEELGKQLAAYRGSPRTVVLRRGQRHSLRINRRRDEPGAPARIQRGAGDHPRSRPTVAVKLVPAAPALPEDPPELIFQWERRSRAHWRLAGVVALSLLAHAVSFYALQVAYTPTGSQLPPPAQVVMIPLDDPGNDAFARWLKMADPSLIAQPVPPSDAETLAALDFHYVPSYEAVRPHFKSLDPLPGEGIVTSPPRPRMPGPVPVGSRTRAEGPRPPESSSGKRTRVLLTGGIETFLDGPLPLVEFKIVKGSEPLEPTVFLVGIRAEGGAPFLFRDSATAPGGGKTRSDDATAPGESARVYPASTAADDFARDYLARLNFRPAGVPAAAGVRWGRAEFAWGNDIYQ